MKDGLANEVKELSAYKDINALQTVGYTELFGYYNNQINLTEAVNKIKMNTRHYAKRQMTWFKKDTDIQWMLPESGIDFCAYISSSMDK